MKPKKYILIVCLTAILLIIPFITMQFIEEVQWNLADFLVAGVLLLCTGFGIDFLWRKIKNKQYRFLGIIILLLLLILIWAELAVGVFGTPFTGS